MNLYSLHHYVRFYLQAVTKYQLHSPAVFSLVNDVLEDEKRYYAFEDIPTLRRALLRKGLSAGHFIQPQIRDSIQVNAPFRQAGERLFRLVRHFNPSRIMMLGSGASIGCLYAAAAGSPKLEIWEGEKAIEPLTRHHMASIIHHPQTWVHHNREEPLSTVMDNDLVIFFPDFDTDDPELRKALFLQAPKAWILMDMYVTPERFNLLNSFRQLPIVRASVDFFDVTVLLPNKGMREVQHIKVVKAGQKPWMFY